MAAPPRSAAVTDIPLRFLVTMMCIPGQPMLVLVDDDELEQHRDRRVLSPVTT
jgi:hypothetical protein